MMSSVRVCCLTIAMFGFVWWGVAADDAAPKPTKAGDVLALWSANISGVKDFSQLHGASTDNSMASATFRVKGIAFGDMWTHYAKQCGVTQTFDPRSTRGDSQRTPLGTYVLSDRIAPDQPDRRTSVFLLKTADYVVSVSLQSEPGDQSVSGSLSVVMQ